MKIDIFMCAVALGRDDDRRSGCGIVAQARYDDGRRQERQFGFRLGCSTTNVALLQGARLALCVVNMDVKRRERAAVTIHIDSNYVHDMLKQKQDGRSYNAVAKTNVEAVARMRAARDAIGSVAIVLDKSKTGIWPPACLELAQQAAQNQTDYDSGTKEVLDGLEEQAATASDGREEAVSS